MWIQQSFKEQKPSLYVVPTPIGNLDDMTFRAINILKKVHLIAAEDTRQTRKLLNYFDIKTPLISYHEHSKKDREEQLIEKIKNNQSIALVSDAGMPAIADPGSRLIQRAIENKINVIPLPGANAALCALVSSGLSTDEFLFYGFLPRKNKERKREIERLAYIQATLIFYESPYRLKETLLFLYKSLGNRRITIAREISKVYEEMIRGTLKDVFNWANKQTFKGEVCLVLEGNISENSEKDDLWWRHLSIEEHVKHYEEKERVRTNQAIKKVANDRNMRRQEVYKIIHMK